jgi:hypothetical protein
MARIIPGSSTIKERLKKSIQTVVEKTKSFDKSQDSVTIPRPNPPYKEIRNNSNYKSYVPKPIDMDYLKKMGHLMEMM